MRVVVRQGFYCIVDGQTVSSRTVEMSSLVVTSRMTYIAGESHLTKLHIG